MDKYTLLILNTLLCCAVAVTSAWSLPHYPVRSAARIPGPPPSRYAPYRVHEQDSDEFAWQRAKRDHNDEQKDDKLTYRAPVHASEPDEPSWQRGKRDHHDDYHNNNHGGGGGVTGPIHTFVKTDKNANYKWGVRHHVGPKYM